MKKIIIIMILAVATSSQVQAQGFLDRMVDKATEKVKDKVDQTVDRTLDRTIDGAGNAVDKALTKKEKKQKVSKNAWQCTSCGTQNEGSKFCTECGGAKPQVVDPNAKWKCPACGTKNKGGKFCAECGETRVGQKTEPVKTNADPVEEVTEEYSIKEVAEPQQKIETWTCPDCGRKGNKGKFCDDCGIKHP